MIRVLGSEQGQSEEEERESIPGKRTIRKVRHGTIQFSHNKE